MPQEKNKSKSEVDISKIKVGVDALKSLYLETKDKLLKEEDIANREITPIFWTGIRQKLRKGENPSIVIKGQTTLGKSTTAMTIAYISNRIVQDIGLETSLPKDKDVNMFNLISPNQISYMRLVRKNLSHTWTVIDEFSDMARTGLNSTTEAQLLEWYTKVCAQKFIYPIYCTPSYEYDKYGLIILEVIDMDKEKKITKLKCYYNDPTYMQPQFLGVITLDVSDILEKEWYKLYYKRKHYVIDLMLKNNIRDERDFEFSLVTLITYHKNKKLAEIGIKDIDVITSDLDAVLREANATYSIVAEASVKQRITALISLIVAKRKAIDELKKVRPKKPLTEEQRKAYAEQIKIYEEKFKEVYDYNLQILNSYLEYLSIGGTEGKEEILKLCKKYGIKTKGDTDDRL